MLNVAKESRFGALCDHFGPFGDHFETILGPFWDHFGTILRLFCDHFKTILGPFWDNFRTISGLLGQVLDYFEINLPFCGIFGFSGPKT